MGAHFPKMSVVSAVFVDLVAQTVEEKRVADLAASVVGETGFVIVRVRMQEAKEPTLQIMVDRPDGGISIDDCAKLSRQLSSAFQAVDASLSDYTIEISSPGIERPLTRLKDFEDHVGIAVRVSTWEAIDERKRFKGVLKGVNRASEKPTIEIETSGDEAYSIPMEAISDAVLASEPEYFRTLLAQDSRKRN